MLLDTNLLRYNFTNSLEVTFSFAVFYSYIVSSSASIPIVIGIEVYREQFVNKYAL